MLAAYETTNPGAPFSAILDHLLALADRADDGPIQEVLDGSAKCHPGAHVHWLDDRAEEHSSSEKAVKNLVAAIRKTRRVAPPA